MESESNRLQQRLQSSVTSTIEEIDREKFRKIRRECTSRSLGCFDNASLTMEQLDNCLHQYNKPQEIAGKIIQNELAKSQDRLQRCNTACQDTVQDKYPRLQSNSGKDFEGTRMTHSLISRLLTTLFIQDAMKLALKCNTSCVEAQINLLKSMKGNILRDLDELTRNLPK